MASRNRNLPSHCPASLDEAIQGCVDHGSQKLRRPPKVLADLMGVELKTLYRWLADNSMPLNRLRQFETFCGAYLISDYLSVAAGRLPITVPTGRKAKVEDLAEVQASFAEAVALLARFYQSGENIEETVAALTLTLTQVAWQRENVLKHANPELGLFGEDA